MAILAMPIARAGRPWHAACAMAILAMPVARAGRPWHAAFPLFLPSVVLQHLDRLRRNFFAGLQAAAVADDH